MKKTNSEFSETETFKRLILVLGISFLLFSISSRIFFRLTGVDENYRISVDNYVSGTYFNSNGSSQSFTGNTFPAVRKGDRLLVELKNAPDNPYSRITNLCFFVSNSRVRATFGQQELYDQTYAEIEKGIMPCNQFYTIALPDDYQTKTIEIEITPVDRSSFTSLNFWLSPSGHSTKNIIAGKEFAFCLLVTMAVISAITAILLTVIGVMRRKFNASLLLALFCFFIVLWNIGSQGYLYLLSDHTLASQGEYINLYAACIPLALYIAGNISTKPLKVIMYGFSAFFAAIFIYATVLNYSPIQASYNTILMVLHAAIILMMITYFISIWTDRRYKKSFSKKIGDYGFRICIIIGLVEFLRFNLVNNFGTSLRILRTSLGPLAIAALVITMILSAGYSYAHDYFEKIEKEHLRVLAYQDNLTGIPNRSACYLGLDSLVNEQVKNYSMFFLDLNYLKKANDTCGHEVGDRMLILTAQAIKKVFEGKGFYGRWGGDEFIACVPGDRSEGDKAITEFHREVQRINDTEKDLPFGLSIAVGRTDSTSGDPKKPIDAVNCADEVMYEDKKRMKAERTD